MPENQSDNFSREDNDALLKHSAQTKTRYDDEVKEKNISSSVWFFVKFLAALLIVISILLGAAYLILKYVIAPNIRIGI